MWILLPVAALFCLLRFIRVWAYRLGLLQTRSFDKPVIVVGNINVGGTGKTPLIIALCEYLKQQGQTPGVVSRGYGGQFCQNNASTVWQLTDSDQAERVGDEPLMIFQRTGCPVVIGRDRAAAAEYLLANNTCSVVLSDDGLQHYRLARQLELIVLDAKRLVGNGFCLPAGPLREPVSRLQSADLVVYNGMPETALAGSDAEMYYQLVFEECINVCSGQSKPLSELVSRDVLAVAVAGIGYPQRFFELLRRAGMQFESFGYADHHHYRLADIQTWQGRTVLMTEKDAVKCQQLIEAEKIDDCEDFWYLPVSARFSRQLEQQLESKLLPCIERFTESE